MTEGSHTPEEQLNRNKASNDRFQLPEGTLTHNQERQKQLENLQASGGIKFLIAEAEKQREGKRDTSSIVVLDSTVDRARVSWEFGLGYKKTRTLTAEEEAKLPPDQRRSYTDYGSLYTPRDHAFLKGVQLRNIASRMTARRVTLECEDHNSQEIDILVSTPEGMKSVTALENFMTELRVMESTFNRENPSERLEWMIHTAGAYAQPINQERQYLEYANDKHDSYVAKMIPQREGNAPVLLYPTPPKESPVGEEV